MQVLYAHELGKENIHKIVTDLMPADVLADMKSKDFTYKIIDSIIANREAIDAYIVKHADNWELDRMAVIDKNLMRMAVAEMLYLDDIPPKVSINEAIEIAKRFSTDKSSKFVNGILDATLNELKGAGHLQKSGRGLVDSPAKKPKTTAAPPPAPPKEPAPSKPPFKPQGQKPYGNQGGQGGQGGYSGGGNQGSGYQSGTNPQTGKPFRPKPQSGQGNQGSGQGGQGGGYSGGGQGGNQGGGYKPGGKPRPNSQGGNRKSY